MQLTSQQIRRYYLAGTVAFPTPYPSVGTISIETQKDVPYPNGTFPEHTFVVVKEQREPNYALVRAVLREEVGAVFVPGESIYDKSGTEIGFEIAEPQVPLDFEKGKWFVTPEIHAGRMASALHLGDTSKIDDRDSSIARGIVFVQEHARVLSMLEANQPAGMASDWLTAAACDPWYQVRCDCKP